MQRVLNPPMVPQGLAVATGARPLTADEVTHLLTRLPPLRALAVTHTDHVQVTPGVPVADAFGVADDRITARLVPAMAVLLRLIRVMIQTGTVRVQGLADAGLNVGEQMGLVVLDGQHVVAAAFPALGGALLLPAHGIDGNQ